MLNALWIAWTPLASAQDQTVGLFLNTAESFDGYTLFAPMLSRTTYLIDNCGYMVNSWDSDYAPGLSVYLTEEGGIIRAGRTQSVFLGGGAGGRLEEYNWDNELIWYYNYSSETFQQHHDFEILPNGNILLIAWELLTPEETLELGRDSVTGQFGLWPDHIVEIEPGLPGEAEIVWEWHVIDHVVQEIDSTRANFGVVSDHPELIDINYLGPGDFPSGADWNHTNSIDFWPEEDLILLSIRTFSEVWVIDHSTTSEQAANHEGGRYGRGGDLLYRWGNPEAYDRGGRDDQRFYGQHDATWITDGPDKGQIMVFNNGTIRPGENYSSVDRITPPFESGVGFWIEDTASWGPTDVAWTYAGDEGDRFQSGSLSGATLQPNGNVLLCVGNTGDFIEVDSNGTKVWNYICPVSNGPIPQGEMRNNNVFKIARYTGSHPGLSDKDLMPLQRIEIDPLPDECELFPADSTTGISPVDLIRDDLFELMGNPVSTELAIHIHQDRALTMAVYSMTGEILSKWDLPGSGHHVFNCGGLNPGVYALVATDTSTGHIQTSKLVVQ